MTVVQIFDSGAVFPPSVLDIEEKQLIDQFMSAVKTVAAIGLATGVPNSASIMHSLINSVRLFLILWDKTVVYVVLQYKNLLAIALATDYDFEASEKLKERLANPEAFAAAAPTEAAASTEAAPAAEAAKEEEKEESDDVRLSLTSYKDFYWLSHRTWALVSLIRDEMGVALEACVAKQYRSDI
jgi:large subunit ribosomal protein LP0